MVSIPDHADILITNAYLITMDPSRRVFQTGAIAIKNGRIIGIGSDRVVATQFKADKSIDAAGSAVLPRPSCASGSRHRPPESRRAGRSGRGR